MPLLKSGISKLTDFTKKGYKNMKLNFKDLVFESDEMTRIKRAKIVIGAYDLSIIQELNNPRYEIAIFDSSERWARIPGINENSDVVPNLTKEDVEGIMNNLYTFVRNMPYNLL